MKGLTSIEACCCVWRAITTEHAISARYQLHVCINITQVISGPGISGVCRRRGGEVNSRVDG
jgi:hypothetical protein